LAYSNSSDSSTENQGEENTTENEGVIGEAVSTENGDLTETHLANTEEHHWNDTEGITLENEAAHTETQPPTDVPVDGN
jgi:hypothetical protein